MQAAAVALIAIVTGWVVWELVLTKTLPYVRKSRFPWAEKIVIGQKHVVRILIVVAGLALGINLAPKFLTERLPFHIILKIITISALFIGIERATTVLFNHHEKKRSSSSNLHIVGILTARLLFAVIGLIMILDALGIAITPLVASLGIGSLAVALALQDTLGNLFSGLYILMDEPIRLGDTVRLEGGEEGIVQRIGWRSTQIRLGTHNLCVIPNSKLAGSRIINLSLPDAETHVPIEVFASYHSDLHQLEQICLNTALQVQKMEGAVENYVPTVRFHDFYESNIGLTVTLRAREHSQGGLLRHEFIKILQREFKNAGIDAPYPRRMVHMDQNRGVGETGLK